MELLIESLEGGIYLAYSVNGDSKTLLKDNAATPLKFACLTQARDHFKDHKFDSAMLVHCSAYDEMCGEQIENNNSLKTELPWF
ncbi:DUF6482 family protein [Vibrio ostreicida]|uniref:DUF6482 family protein n=1 Tax=Vibrio ostreicida TaxID=526588 RepID=A0ABT8BVC7_9VIBR|nr:DUF6482 family protein [Vibrio ostreicida]MDN3610057.1 DUF6482 family protein [Vibrio ostreicida]NPD10073.1 Na(+)-translocating NADH-quinone reductase subunit B [Vibrio ostreicida]